MSRKKYKMPVKSRPTSVYPVADQTHTSTTPNTHKHNLSSSSNVQPSPERSLMRAGVASIQRSTIHHYTIIPEQSSTHTITALWFCSEHFHATHTCKCMQSYQHHHHYTSCQKHLRSVLGQQYCNSARQREERWTERE